MKVIVKHKRRKGFSEYDSVNVFVPKRTTKLVDTLRELWEQEYNSSDPEPDREQSWFEEEHARVENNVYITEFYVTTLVEVE